MTRQTMLYIYIPPPSALIYTIRPTILPDPNVLPSTRLPVRAPGKWRVDRTGSGGGAAAGRRFTREDMSLGGAAAATPRGGCLTDQGPKAVLQSGSQKWPPESGSDARILLEECGETDLVGVWRACGGRVAGAWRARGGRAVGTPGVTK